MIIIIKKRIAYGRIESGEKKFPIPVQLGRELIREVTLVSLSPSWYTAYIFDGQYKKKAVIFVSEL